MSDRGCETVTPQANVEHLLGELFESHETMPETPEVMGALMVSILTVLQNNGVPVVARGFTAQRNRNTGRTEFVWPPEFHQWMEGG